jgi:uncharacterized coiled-coil DUF342 family protein
MIAEEMEARVEELRRNNRELHQEILAMGQRLNTAQVMINELYAERMRLQAMVDSLQGGEE